MTSTREPQDINEPSMLILSYNFIKHFLAEINNYIGI